MYYIYRIKLHAKGKADNDIAYQTWEGVKVFPPIRQDIKQGAYRTVDRDGYTVIDMRPHNVYQDTYDSDAWSDKIIIKNGGMVVLEAPSPDTFDKLAILWHKCSCGNSPVYRMRLDYVGESSNPPTYVKTIVTGSY